MCISNLYCSVRVASLSGLLAIGAATTASPADPLPDAGFPQSYGVQLKTHNFTTEVMDQAREIGFTIVRRGFYWNGVETQKGQYDFSDYDQQMAYAKKHGLLVVGVLFNENKMYEDDGRGGIQTEAGREGFADFGAALAGHYRDQPVIWEVWNEPNVRTFWRKDGMHNSDEFAQEYTDLVKTVVPRMVKANPDVFVVAGSVSNYWQPSYEWTEFCFKKGILDSGIRGWSVHPYGVKTPEEFAVGHKITRDLLAKYGKPDLPMVNTERGFAVKESHEGWSGGSKERAREFQSWHFVRQYMADQMHDVRFTIWYEWDGDKFGIADENGSRPVFPAAKTLGQQLNGYKLVKRLDASDDLDYVLLWENNEGDRKLVAWTAPPPGAAPDEAWDHPATVKTSESGVFALTDLYGQASKVEGDLVLQLSGAPQYVALPKGISVGEVTAPKRPVANAVDNPMEARGLPLSVFDSKADWKFIENTGKGTFEVGKDEQSGEIGILHYDFTQSTAKGKPYVLATTPVEVIRGATELVIHARSSIRQPLTFRLTDSTGQTHQYKKQIAGSGQWEAITIPLTKRLEHWGGANDGTVHFPVTSLVFSVPQPDEEHKTGQVEYGYVRVQGDGG